MCDGLRFLNVRIFAFPCLNISLNKIDLGFAFSREKKEKIFDDSTMKKTKQLILD